MAAGRPAVPALRPERLVKQSGALDTVIFFTIPLPLFLTPPLQLNSAGAGLETEKRKK